MRRGHQLLEIALIVCLLALLVAVGLPDYLRLKERAREGEVKSHLHDIQLAVEKYGVGQGDSYPPYLIGGSAGPDLSRASDPLLREGYLQHYPANPFMAQPRAAATVKEWQASLPTSTIYGNDPLRPGTPESAVGLRFGAQSNLMGSVLADPRWRQWSRVDAGTKTVQRVPSYADVEYDFWDIAPPGERRQFLPGEFFYKEIGTFITSINPQDHHDAPPPQPRQVDSYMLGAYGSIRTVGHDVLGPEWLIPSREKAQDGSWIESQCWHWTRSQVGDPDLIAGSPIGYSGTHMEVSYGNANGVPDGLILILTAGDDAPFVN